MPKPGDSITTEFITSSSTGAATNADSLPTAVLSRNGSDDGAVTVTVTNIDAGRYKSAFTIPSTYAAGDELVLIASYTVSTVAQKQKAWESQLADQLDSLRVKYGVRGNIWLVDPVNGNDSTGNGTWAQPFATPLPTAVGGSHQANAGDLVYVLRGTCAIGNNFYALPIGVSLVGAGEYETVITGTYSAFGNDKGTIFCGGMNTISDLTVQTVSADGVFQLPITDAPGCTSILIERVRVIGITDCLYFWFATDVLARHCHLICNWDCIYAANAGTTVTVEDSTLVTRAHNVTSLPNNNSTVQCVDGATVTVIRSPISNVSIDTNPSRITRVVHSEHVSAAGAMVTLIQSPVYLSVDGVTKNNLVVDSGTTMLVENSPYDPTSTSIIGTFVEQTSKSGLDFNNISQARNSTNLANVTIPVVTTVTNPTGLNGSNTVTIAFEDASNNPVPGVSFTVVGQGSYFANSSGTASFGLPNGTYTVNANPVNGIIFPSTSLTVNGNTSQTINGAATSLTSVNPSDQVAYGNIYNSDNSPATGQVVNFRVSEGPSSGGVSACYLRRTMQSTTADSSGLFQFDVPKGGYVVEFWVDGGAHSSFVTSSAGSIQIGPVYGAKTP